MAIVHIIGLALSTSLLWGCASQQYWQVPPPGDSTSKNGLDGRWQGMVKHRYTQRYSHGALAGAVRIRCAPYQDLISLQVDNGQLQGTLGTSPPVRFTSRISSDGQFRHQMPVQGDTWIYGGVGIFHTEPTLTVSGQLNPFTGLGQGEVAVTPGKETLGCYGHFRLSRNAAPPSPDTVGPPFKIQYWIDRQNRDDNGGRIRLLR